MTPDGPQLYGFRTVSAVVRSYMAANVRETLTLDRDINLIGDSFVGRTIDGQGLVFQDLYNELATRLRRDYDLGALFGATSSDAYNVDVGSTVNTRDSIRAGVIAARVWYIPSPTAEKVVINLIRNPVPTS
jgi:phage tail sheath protein FI